LTFVPFDLRAARLSETLAGAGASRSTPTFFTALGLAPYLSPDTLLGILRLIAIAFPRGSEIAFDYMVAPDLLPAHIRETNLRWQTNVALAGEPVASFVVPSELKQTLLAAGFRDVEHLDVEAVNGRYFFAREDGLRAAPGIGLVRAAV
jgi:O-methyltransferase involved in polyketide biosynthesis